jgi:hypothetical protein
MIIAAGGAVAVIGNNKLFYLKSKLIFKRFLFCSIGISK